jgi:uncharacterized protein (DUF362 family)
MARVVLNQAKSANYYENDIAETIGNTLDKLAFNYAGISKVVIKPNLCYYWNYSTGETTDPRVVSALIDYVRHKLGERVDISVAEADASAMKTKYAFSVLGYDKMCLEKNVKLINLSEGEKRDVSVRVKGKDLVLPINDILLNADLIINVPKLKTHDYVGTTCALKNMFGAISKPRKYSYHKILSHVIVGVNKIVKSHITVVDGFIVKGAYPKKIGVVLAGDDPLAVDFTAARIMGFRPKSISHLNLAEKEGIGETRRVELIEMANLGKIKKIFPYHNYVMHNISWGLQLKMLRSYVKFAGDVLPPFLEK